MAKDKKFGVEVIVSATDKASAEFKAINKRIANSGLGKLSNSFRFLSGASGFNQVTKSIGKFGDATSNAASEFGSLLTKLAALGGVGGGGVFLLAKSFADFADNVGDSADKLGMSTQAYQKFSIGAKLAGIDTEAFNLSVGRLSRSVGEAAIAGGPTAQIMRKLGVSIRDSKGHLRSMDSILPETITKLDKLKSASIRNAVGAKLFGKSFQTLVPYIKDFQRYTKDADGFILSKQDIERGNQFKDQIVKFTATFGLLKVLAGSQLMAGFSEGLTFFEGFLNDNRENLKQFFKAVGDSLPAAFRALAASIVFVTKFFTVLDEKTGKTELNFGRLKFAAIAFGAILAGPFLASLIAVASSFGSMALAIGGFMAKIAIFATGAGTTLEALGIILGAIFSWPVLIGAAFVAAGLLIWKYWEPIKNLFSDIWGFIVKIGDKWSGIFSKQNFSAAFGSAPMAQAAPVNTSFVAAPVNSYSEQNASLKVSFDNMPRGTKVSSQSSGWQDLLIDRGYAMGGL